MRTAYLALLLVGCIGLLQWHGIQFWMERVDPATGWAWSLLLEGLALWFWYSRRRGAWVLGLVATSLTLAGPLHHVASPLFTHMAAASSTASSGPVAIAALQRAIATDETALASFLQAAEKRSGWQPTIDRTQSALEAKREELRSLMERQDQARQQTALAWQAQAVIAMQAVALLLFQIGAVLATRSLSNARRERGLLIEAPAGEAHQNAASDALPLPLPKAPQKAQLEAPQKPRQTPRRQGIGRKQALTAMPRLQQRLALHLEAEGMRVSEFAALCGLDRREVSAVLNWQAGRRLASRRVADRIAGAIPSLVLVEGGNHREREEEKARRRDVYREGVGVAAPASA